MSRKPKQGGAAPQKHANKKQQSHRSSNKLKPLANDSRLNDSDLDEIDHFYEQRDQVLLSSDGAGSSGEEWEGNAIMDLPSSSDDHSDEGCRKEDADFDDISDDGLGSEEEDEGDERWGRRKQSYYAADQEAGEEEAKEAARLQRKRLGALSEGDFFAATGLDGAGSSSTTQKEGEIVYFSSSSESASEDGDEQEDQRQAQKGDSVEFDALMVDFKDKLRHLRDHLGPAIANRTSNDPKLSHGLAFLRVKHRLLSAYCTYVAYYIAMKVEGKQVEGHPVIDRLVEYRLLLERIKPLEARVQSQVDRLLQAAAKADQDDLAIQAGSVQFVDDGSGEEEAHARPRPEAMLPFDVRHAEGEDGEQVYRPPRIAPLAYPEAGAESAKQGKHEERLQKHKSRSRLLRELGDALGDNGDSDDAPPEDEDYAPYKRHTDRREAQREAYEEENMMRFTEARAGKHASGKRAKPVDELDGLDSFFDEVQGMRYEDGAKSSSNSSKKVKRSKKEDGSDISEIEDDLYQQAIRGKQSLSSANKKASSGRKKQGTTSFRPIVDQPASYRRPADYAILKNKGLTPHRPKDVRNPRVHNRNRFERAEKRLGSFKPVARGGKAAGTKKYSGEGSGIRTNLSRSVRF